jgi:hypothetical protein
LLSRRFGFPAGDSRKKGLIQLRFVPSSGNGKPTVEVVSKPRVVSLEVKGVEDFALPMGSWISPLACSRSVIDQSIPFQTRLPSCSVRLRIASAAEGISSSLASVSRTVPILSMGYRLYTECAQSRGPENIGPERPLPGLLALEASAQPTRITLENNGKIRPQPDRENAFARASGGDEGIRTLETL